ncbi:hypothetical protein BD410DRAFT_733068 [Rickenella mellea]|uniref:C2H2-type domain-containing protein n=1 Tax=Rickenella mellea TaxID=50990 RepID=A0A4Y7PIV0_9AGAM|nr:hypothetical protein BD410DRAFT_733068 [Rickenella mellea]
MIHWASQRFPTDDARRLEAKYICPLHGCGSTFVRHFNLRVHMQSHSGQKPFKCEWPGCGELFSRQLDCKRHELRHHNIGSYTCQGCRQQFADMDSLNHHRECFITTIIIVHH